MNKKVILIILDGWGIAQDKEVSAIDKANTPFIDSLWENYPTSKLRTSGMDVGLPDGQMGNSEVGHMNIGAGRIVYQDLVKINRAVDDGSLKENRVLQESFKYASENNKNVHFMGLVSDGGVHSHIKHVKGLCSFANEWNLENVFVHAFTDGRDTDPKSGVGFISDLEEHMDKTTGKLATVVGRYYAMDRDKRWERVKKAYDCLVHAKGEKTADVISNIMESYENDVTDEFLKPIVVTDEDGKPVATIEEKDVVICFNFRTDRARQITVALTQKDFPDHEMQKIPLHYVTMTNYDDTFEGIHVIYGKEHLNNTLGEIISKAGKKQIRIAETEKYPHVTYFFSGGREEEFDGEKRILCPSPKVATYDLKPEMSAFDVRDEIIREIEDQWPDFVCLNFANPDMVGHTGVFEAAVKACETVDSCTESIIEKALENNYTCLITADHGNSDFMINDDGSPNTAHTKNPVPLFIVGLENSIIIKDGKLGDLAPTILKLMGLKIPDEMNGDILIEY